MNVKYILDQKRVKLDKNGIWLTNMELSNDSLSSQATWEKIYDFDKVKFKEDRNDFKLNKLEDHMSYITKSFSFSPNTLYLEIGCGPAYIGEYLMKKYDCYFVGIDFNYHMLLVLKDYLEKLKYKKFILIHGDIHHMPIKNSSVDFIYGGGVIEHFKDTSSVLKELHRVLRKDGVSFNTVPAFNFFWPMSMKKNIPSLPILKTLFELLHIKIFRNKLLNIYHGYELSFTKNQLKNIHKQLGFKKVTTGAFAFHPSSKKIKNVFLRNIYFAISKQSLISPIIYIAAKK